MRSGARSRRSCPISATPCEQLWKLDKRQAAEQGRELPDQTPVAPAESPQDCPDCKGSGWWYPEGQERGVAKCRHSKLETGSSK